MRRHILIFCGLILIVLLQGALVWWLTGHFVRQWNGGEWFSVVCQVILVLGVWVSVPITARRWGLALDDTRRNWERMEWKGG